MVFSLLSFRVEGEIFPLGSDRLAKGGRKSEISPKGRNDNGGVEMTKGGVEMTKGRDPKFASLFEMSERQTPSVISSGRRNLFVGVGIHYQAWQERRDFSQGSK